MEACLLELLDEHEVWDAVEGPGEVDIYTVDRLSLLQRVYYLLVVF